MVSVARELGLCGRMYFVAMVWVRDEAVQRLGVVVAHENNVDDCILVNLKFFFLFLSFAFLLKSPSHVQWTSNPSKEMPFKRDGHCPSLFEF